MITSEKNSKIQWVKALISLSKERKNSSAFVVEGVRLLEDAIQSNFFPKIVLYSGNLSERGLTLVDKFRDKQVPVEEIPTPLMNKIADTETPQGILGVISIRPDVSLPQDLNFVLICDAIRDPGNLGTILRTAASAGVQIVFIGPDTTDPYAPKVVRSAMGAHFHIPLLKLSWPEIQTACLQRNKPLTINLASADAPLVYWKTNFSKPTAIIIGNEADGPGTQAISMADHQLAIPMPGNTESLNAAIAAGILLYEVVRQRCK